MLTQEIDDLIDFCKRQRLIHGLNINSCKGITLMVIDSLERFIEYEFKSWASLFDFLETKTYFYIKDNPCSDFIFSQESIIRVELPDHLKFNLMDLLSKAKESHARTIKCQS